IDFHQRVVCSLKINNKIYGYLWLYETAALTDEELALLDAISSHLAQVLYHQAYAKEDEIKTFLWNVMNDEFLNEAYILQAAKLVNFDVPDTFTVLVYSVNNTDYYDVLEKIRLELRQERIAYYFGKGTEIIGIIDDRGKHPLEKAKEIMYAIHGKIS